jgi:hypothetical protein
LKTFLYYDQSTGVIKAISPVQSSEFDKWALTKLDIPTANKFLMGEWDTNHWFVSSNTTEDKCVLSMNQFDYLPQTSTTIEVLPRSEHSQHIKTAIGVTIYTKLQKFELSVAPEAAKLDLSKIEDDTMEFFITKRNDPSHILGMITTNAKELFEKGTLIFDFPVEGNDFSVSTKRLFRFYQLTVRRNKVSNRVKHSHHRYNTLVPYTRIKTMQDGKDGIIVVHNVNKDQLEISLDGEVYDITTDASSEIATLFLTRERDPTILIDIVKLDLRDIDYNKTVVIPVPHDAGVDFGISGFPYVDKLSFLRK